jgi:hypothetical protein
LIDLFGRKSAAVDLEEAVRRRIVGKTTGSEASSAIQSAADWPPIALESADADESPGLLLRNLAGALKHTGVEIATVTARNDGFLVDGALKGAAFRQWYSVHDVRQLGADRAAKRDPSL